MNIDLASIDTVAACNAGADVELLHPVTREPLGIFWRVLGRDSDVFKAHVNKNVNAKMRRAMLAKKRGRDAEPTTAEEAEADAIELLVACSAGWRTGDMPTIEFKGSPLAFDENNARRVLTALPWIRSQVDEAVGDLENFMRI